MPQTLLGLDIGQSTIKAVLLTPKGLAGGRILGIRTLDIEACGGIEGALKKLAEDKIFSGFPCVVCLPESDILSRQVNLPFRDDKKIRKTLPFELEPLIPVPIEDVVTDYLTIPQDGLLVAALAKDKIREWIDKVEANLGDLAVLDAASSALAIQTLRGKNFSGVGIILDIGRHATTAIFYENESVVHVRSIAFGGETITRSIAQELSLDWNQAEAMKISGNDRPAVMGAVEACRHFCAELKNTIEFMLINGAQCSKPERIAVTGGGSLFMPLRQALESHFPLPVEALDLIRSKQLDVAEEIKNQMQPEIINTAVAAALRLSTSKKSFDFRQGEFAAKHTQLDVKKQWKWAAIVVGVILMLALVNQILDFGLKTMQLGGIKKQISQIFKSSFPEAVHVNEALQIQHVRTKIDEYRKSFGPGEGLPDAKTVDLLKDISALIPSSLDIIMTDLHYENRVISLKGQAKTIDDVTAVRNELLKSRYFKEVTLGSTSLTKDGGKVDFSMRIDVQ
ncbi:MAG: pilus assembly protein PilM [Smithella sp.]|nr:pilus assembly protein PilM [Smithella sp.]